MGDVSFRNWDIWVNNIYVHNSAADVSGHYECYLLPTLMVEQTVEFLSGRFQISTDNISRVLCYPLENVQKAPQTNAPLHIDIQGTISLSQNIEGYIRDVLNELEAISICVDSPLVCTSIKFITNYGTQLFFANRRPFGRGMAFEVEEREIAQKKLVSDFSFYKTAAPNIQVAYRHYLTGMTLLGLEDQVSGLIDAAYIQFCQGCEAVCKTSGNLNEVCRWIALKVPDDSRDLQIIAHHVWQVRNKYYGHGDVDHNLKAITDPLAAYQATKQILVARYLCKRLIDMEVPSHQSLIREMRIYPSVSSEMYCGTVEELSTSFRVDYYGRTAKIYNPVGKEIDKHHIK